MSNKLVHFEKSIIFHCLTGRIAEIMCFGITPSMFSDHDYGKAYETAVKQNMAGLVCDLPTLCSEFADNRLISDKIVEASFGTMSTLNLEWICSKILNADSLRNKLKGLHDIYSDACKSDPTEPYPFDEKLHAIMMSSAKSSSVDVIDAEYIRGYRKRFEEDLASGGMKGIRTGIDTLDRQLGGGLKPKRMITIAGRPGAGKTSLATNMALQASMDGANPLYITLELGTDEIIERLICADKEIDTKEMNQRVLSPSSIDKFMLSTSEMATRKFCVCSKTAGSWEKVVMHINHEVKFRGVDVVFLDYIQQFRTNNHRLSTREHMNVITGQCKSLAQDLNIPIVVVAQLNRDIEKRAEKIPVMSDLKESGSIEADSDVVLILYWIAENSAGNVENTLGMEIVKNRQGKSGPIEFKNNFAYNKFYGAK